MVRRDLRRAAPEHGGGRGRQGAPVGHQQQGPPGGAGRQLRQLPGEGLPPLGPQEVAGDLRVLGGAAEGFRRGHGDEEVRGGRPNRPALPVRHRHGGRCALPEHGSDGARPVVRGQGAGRRGDAEDGGAQRLPAGRAHGGGVRQDPEGAGLGGGLGGGRRLHAQDGGDQEGAGLPPPERGSGGEAGERPPAVDVQEEGQGLPARRDRLRVLRDRQRGGRHPDQGQPGPQHGLQRLLRRARPAVRGAADRDRGGHQRRGADLVR
mmetsp:Transcript_48018/g.137310  ORF Transcript_48018/g.137310 Transcript_48018/m.137310 type:complete len:263 (-) Transcript_48018:169-957(-)